jgi:hypothetical protein
LNPLRLWCQLGSLLIGDALAYTHICAGPHKGVRDRVDEFTRNAKVADLDLSFGIGKDIGGLDIWMLSSRSIITCSTILTSMDDTVHVVQVH